MTLRRFIKFALPSLYDTLIKLGTSKFSRRLRGLLHARREAVQIRRNLPYFAVDIGGRMGLGAMLSQLVLVLDHCERMGLTPRVRFTNPLYAPEGCVGSDWLPHYFLPVTPKSQTAGSASVPLSHNILAQLRRGGRRLSVADAHRLLIGYLCVRPELRTAAETRQEALGISKRTLGVHYRGTDKRLEARTVGPQALCNFIRARVESGRFDNVFVATDEPTFLDRIRAEAPHLKIVDLDCREIYGGARPAHMTAGDGELKAVEAILTILCLGACGACVRSSSHLSAWAKILTPDLPVVFVTAEGAPEAGSFPEGAVWADAEHIFLDS